MNHQLNRRLGTALVAGSLMIGLAACSTSESSPSPSSAAPTPTTAQSAAAPTDPVAAAAWEALMSPEGEYAASAAYQAVIATYGQVQPYVSIQAAEERHISALTRQLQRLGVEVPPNPYLGTIPAPADLTAAATAWAEGEVKNVALYDRLISAVAGDQALTRVFTNLRRASEVMHLPAFQEAAKRGGQLTEAEMAGLGLH
ncbi:MAG: hypothetical protein IPL94_00380 [Tetrasphaera sp.]|nr:hypothetical protein [Tetrasphaera sp.]